MTRPSLGARGLRRRDVLRAGLALGVAGPWAARLCAADGDALTIAFGAKTRPGSGAAALPPAREWRVEGGALAGVFECRDGRLTPVQSLSAGGTVELQAEDGRRLIARIDLVPGAYSCAPGDPATTAASWSEVRAALSAEDLAYGDRILLRGGEYGWARTGTRRDVDVGPEGSWRPGGDVEADGPVVIEPHPGETPLVFSMRFGGLSDVTIRDLQGRTESDAAGSFRFSARGRHAVFQSVGETRNVRLERLTVRATRPLAIDEYNHLPHGLSHGAGEGNSVIGCRVADCENGIVAGGRDFEISGCVTTRIAKDCLKGNGSPKAGTRILWNVFESSIKSAWTGAVASVRFTSDGALLVRFEPGVDVAVLGARFNRRDGRMAWAGAPASPAGLEAALGAIRSAVGLIDFRLEERRKDGRRGDAATWEPEEGRLRLDLRFVDQGNEKGRPSGYSLPRDVPLDREIPTPGLVWSATNAHADVMQFGGGGGGEGPEANADVHVVGNVFGCFFPNAFGARRSQLGAMFAPKDSPWDRLIMAGNVATGSTRNGLKPANMRNGIVALNTCASDFAPKERAPLIDTREYTSSLPPQPSPVARNYGDTALSKGSRTFAVDNETLEERETLIAAFTLINDYGRNDLDPDDFNAIYAFGRSLYRPRPGFRPDKGTYGDPALVDSDGRSYDPAGLLALRDAYQRNAAVRGLLAEPPSKRLRRQNPSSPERTKSGGR